MIGIKDFLDSLRVNQFVFLSNDEDTRYGTGFGKLGWFEFANIEVYFAFDLLAEDLHCQR